MNPNNDNLIKQTKRKRSKTTNYVPQENFLAPQLNGTRSNLAADLFQSADSFELIQSESTKNDQDQTNFQDGDFAFYNKFIVLISDNQSPLTPICIRKNSTAGITKPPKKINPYYPPNDALFHLNRKIEKLNLEFISHTTDLTESNKPIRMLSETFQSLHYRNIKFARKFFKYEIALDLLIHDLYSEEIDNDRFNIDSCVQFQLFIDKNKDKIKFVNLPLFGKNILRGKTNQEAFNNQVNILRTRIKSLPQMHLPKDDNDVISRYMDQNTKTGKIMSKFKESIEEFRYPDLEIIGQAISENENEPLDNVINILFDCAWYFKEYPICDPFTIDRIPKNDTIIPKVFDPPFLKDEWTYMTFGELYSANWPLKPAVEELFDLMLITNPFEIAKKFYSIINVIGRCVQRIFIWQNKQSNVIDIDFDQLFVLMLLCIFTSGLSEILMPMRYSYSFREFIMDDYQIQYAMSHMEGLCQYIQNMNWEDSKKKSSQLLKEHLQDIKEPLLK